MKYGREVTVGSQVRLTEVVSIPDPLPGWAQTPQAFLAKQFPTLDSAWIQVEDWNQGGDVKNEDGSYGVPPPPPEEET